MVLFTLLDYRFAVMVIDQALSCFECDLLWCYPGCDYRVTSRVPSRGLLVLNRFIRVTNHLVASSIMPEFLGSEVQIIVDGRALEEFGTEELEEERTVTCYIPSEVGQVGPSLYIVLALPVTRLVL